MSFYHILINNGYTRKGDKMKKYKDIIIAVALPLLVGFISSFFTMNSMEVYNSLNKPTLSPPGYVFGIVWTILYILMGIGSYIVYKSDNPDKMNILKLYIIQLIMNGLWPIFFFVMEKYLFSTIWLILLIGVVFLNVYFFFQVNKKAGLLLVPYLLWLIFALYLNFYIFIYN